jgi:transcriptional regulator with XRE-family HTH domain
MDLSMVIRHRLKEMNLEQRDLATALDVTESYVSQLLNGKKAPPAPDRTDIYEKMENYLSLPKGEVVQLASLERLEKLKRKLEGPLTPLFKEVRELLLSKCNPENEKQIRTIFEKQAFGEMERLVTQKLLDVVKTVARRELENENWLRQVSRLSGKSYEDMRVFVLDFLDTDVLNVSVQNWIGFLDPLIEYWDIDPSTFAMEIALNHRVGPAHPKKFEFVELEPEPPLEAGLKEFLANRTLSGDAMAEEIEFLRKLRFNAKHPTALYYYRELQNLRDPLHFRTLNGA